MLLFPDMQDVRGNAISITHIHYMDQKLFFYIGENSFAEINTRNVLHQPKQGNQRWQTSPAAPPVCVPNFIVIG